MKALLTKENLVILLENIKINKLDKIFIHHPITEDIITVNVKLVKKDTVMVSIDENSPYFGQPDFSIKKTQILGLK